MKYFKISFYLNVLLFITAGFICLVLIECCFHFNTYLSQLRNQSQLTFSSSSKESFKNKVIVGIGGSSLYGEPYDGKIDIFDLATVGLNYGKTC